MWFLAELTIRVIAPIIFIGLLYFFRRAFYKLRYKNYGRDFTENEYGFIRSLSSKLNTNNQTSHYPMAYSLFAYSGSFPALIGMVLGGGSVWFIYAYFRSKFLQSVPAGAYKLNAEVGLSFAVIPAIITGALIVGVAIIIFARRSPLFRKYLVHEGGWGTMFGFQREWIDYVDDIEHLAFQEKIQLNHSNHDIPELTKLIFEGMNNKILFCTSYFAVLTVYFLLLDVNYYSWIENDEVVESRYFSLQQDRYNFNEINLVERSCRISKNDNGPRAHFEYAIIGPNGARIDFGHEPWEDAKRYISAFEKSIEKSPVEINLAPVLKNEPKTMETCLKYLVHDYNMATQLLLWQVYDIDQWNSQMKLQLDQKAQLDFK